MEIVKYAAGLVLSSVCFSLSHAQQFKPADDYYKAPPTQNKSQEPQMTEGAKTNPSVGEHIQSSNTANNSWQQAGTAATRSAAVSERRDKPVAPAQFGYGSKSSISTDNDGHSDSGKAVGLPAR